MHNSMFDHDAGQFGHYFDNGIMKHVGKYDTALTICRIESRPLSHIYYATYRKIMLTKIMGKDMA